MSDLDALYAEHNRALAEAEAAFRAAAERIVRISAFGTPLRGDIRYYEGVAERVRKELRQLYPAPHSTKGQRKIRNHASKETQRKARQRARSELTAKYGDPLENDVRSEAADPCASGATEGGR